MKNFFIFTLIIWNLAITSFAILNSIEIQPTELKIANELNIID